MSISMPRRCACRMWIFPDVGMAIPAVGGIGAALGLSGDVDTPEVDVDIDAPEVDVDLPSVDVDVPEVDIDVPSVDMELEAPSVDVDIDAPTLRVPDVDIPDVGMAIPAVGGIGAALGLSGDVDTPEVDVDIDAPEVDVDLPSVDVDVPEVDIDVPSVDMELEAPSVDVDIDAPSVDVDVDAPTLRVPDVDIPDVGMAIPAVAGIGAALGLSGDVDAPEVDVDVPSVDVDIDVPDVDVEVPSVDVDVETRGLELAVDTPDLEIETVEVAAGDAAPEKVDNLKLVYGIDAEAEEVLYRRGIYTFEQLVSYDPAQLRLWLEEEGLEADEVESWSTQSSMLAQGIMPQVDVPEPEVTVSGGAAIPDHVDNFELLYGINADGQELLYRRGIYTYDQLASYDPAQLRLWFEEEGLDSFEVDTLPEQGRLLASGVMPEIEISEPEIEVQSGGAAPDRIDNLMMIQGISPEMQALLYRRGIYTYDQLADVDPAELRLWMAEDDRDAAEVDTWGEQSRLLSTGIIPQVDFEEGQYVVHAGDPVPEKIDNFKLIRGVGPASEEMLYRQGIHTYEELADTDPARLQGWVTDRGWVNNTVYSWPTQAGILAGGALADVEIDGDEINVTASTRSIPTQIDDLKLIKGVGPKVENMLFDKGLYSYNQVAEQDPAEMNAWLADNRWYVLEADSWPEQARLLAQGIMPEVEVKSAKLSINEGAAAPEQIDNLKLVQGVTPTTEKLLFSNGVYTYDQLADVDPMTLQGWLADDDRQVVEAQSWPMQAGLLARGVAPSVEISGGEVTVSEGQAVPDEQDNLKLVKGIGPKVESLMFGKGIYTFNQLADMDHREIDGWVDERGWRMMDTSTWPEQARILAGGSLADVEISQTRATISEGGSAPSKIDDLKLVKGIGPKTEELLFRRGIYTFEQLAEQDPEELNAWLDGEGWHVMEAKSWPEQARWLAQGIMPEVEVRGSQVVVIEGQAAPEKTDNLKLVNGIGPKVEELLYRRGIYTFEQLADTDHRDIDGWVDDEGWRMMDTTTWPEQARLLAQGIMPDVKRTRTRSVAPAGDDFKVLPGMDDAAEAVLNTNGVTTYQQLSEREPFEINSWLAAEGRDIPEAEIWPEQASLLSRGLKLPPAAKPGEKDDLKRVKGIGPKIERELNKRGVYTFEQLSKTELDYLDALMVHLGWRRICDPETWSSQSRQFYQEKLSSGNE